MLSSLLCSYFYFNNLYDFIILTLISSLTVDTSRLLHRVARNVYMQVNKIKIQTNDFIRCTKKF